MRKLAALLSVFAVALCTTGCATRSIEAASTELSIATPMGKTITATLPKELDATELKLSVDPATGVITLSAKTLKTTSQGLVGAASAAQADALGKLAETVTTLAPLVAPALK